MCDQYKFNLHNIIVEIISNLLKKLAKFAEKHKELYKKNHCLQKSLHMQADVEQHHQSVVYTLEYKIKELSAHNAELQHLEEQHARKIHVLEHENKQLRKGISQMGYELDALRW